MIFYSLGIDYKSAPLEVREAVFKERREISDFWQVYNPQAAILCTCNRLEIYAGAKNASEYSEIVETFIKRFEGFSYYGYLKYGRQAVFKHALRLASGLESQLTGELQILNQLNSWISKDSFPLPLRQLWLQVLALSRDIRVQSGLNEDSRNIANIVFSDLRKRAKFSGKMKIMLVGTGKIAQLIASACPPNTQLYIVAGKNFSKAAVLANQFNASAIAIRDLAKSLPAADALLSATASPHYVLKKEHFQNVGKRSTPLFIYDLAMPRDVEPQVRDIPGLFLQDLEGLKGLFYQENNKISGRIHLAQYLVEEAMKKYKDNLNEEVFEDRHAAQPVGN